MDNKRTKVCPYCGQEILAVAKKCKHCGKWIEEATPIAAVESQPQGKTSSTKSTSISKPIVCFVLFVIIVVAGVLLFIGNLVDSKTYLSSLKSQTEVRHDILGDQEYEYYTTSSGQKYEGEAWESNDLECVYMQEGMPVQMRFYYPNGQLGVTTEAWEINGVTSHGICFDSKGNEIPFDQFVSEYIDKYGDKLKNKEYLIGF